MEHRILFKDTSRWTEGHQHVHFTGAKTEAQRNQVTSPKSPMSQVVELPLSHHTL